MTLTADDSYLTVAEADALAADDIGPEVDRWTALDPVADLSTKEAVLKRATREVDAYVSSGWDPYDPDQVLLFPREIDVDAAGDPFIPRKVQLATYQQAIFVLSNKDELAVANGQRWREGRDETEDAFGAGPIPVGEPCRLARHYLAGFRTAPKAGRGGGIGSARVASGFSGTW